MITTFRILPILILGCVFCRNAAAEPAQGTGQPAQPAVIAGQKVDADLPGIGESSGAVPSAQPIIVSDPIEPVNRAFFMFNDKLYFWVLSPVARGYAYIVPYSARRCVRNFFSNITTPVRLVNCTLQTDFEGAWVETERFVINTTVGVAGFGDPARNRWNMEKRDEDLGQTLGWYGAGPSIYFDWPILGPSNVRDTVGYVGDLFLDPINYIVPKYAVSVGIKAYETVNSTSLRKGEYEDFKDAAIDPYVALRDAYSQYRQSQIVNGEKQSARPAIPVSTE